MPTLSRKWIVPLGLLLTLTVAYFSFAARQAPHRTPVEELEAVVAPYQLKYGVETNVPRRLVITADQREILVRPSWVQIELDEKGGTSISGFTAWNVSIFGWSTELQAALLSALNDSPATARQLVEHPDERIQFLLLKVLSDWGHNRKTFAATADSEHRLPLNLKPHAVEALLAFSRRSDPHVVGTVVSALKFKGKFSTDVFRAAMAHNSSEIRAQALCWLDPEQQQLTTAEIQEAAPVLIEHLTDRDLVVRQWSMTGLQSLVAYWEQSLGGAPIDLVRTDQEQMIKLPVAPASNRWYSEVLPQASKLAKPYQAEWQAWLAKAEQSL